MTRIDQAIRTYTQKREASDRKDRPYKHAILVLTGFSVVAAAVGCIIAGEALNLTAQQTKTGQEALIAVQRAFMFPKLLTIDPDEMPGTGQAALRVMPIWENSGATPTRDLHIWFNVNLMQPEDVPSANLVPPADTILQPSVAGPHATINGAQSLIERNSFIASGRLGHPVTVVYGQAEYSDVFGKPHITMFCYEFNRVTPLENTKAVSAVGAMCPRHNCADEECKAHS